MNKLTDQLRKQFDELRTRREEILSRSTPLREERDRVVNEARAFARAANIQIKEIEAGLREIDTDISNLARALGGRRMSDT
jgi:uncharacterized coiled-coil DUF342 family protein